MNPCLEVCELGQWRTPEEPVLLQVPIVTVHTTPRALLCDLMKISCELHPYDVKYRNCHDFVKRSLESLAAPKDVVQEIYRHNFGPWAPDFMIMSPHSPDHYILTQSANNGPLTVSPVKLRAVVAEIESKFNFEDQDQTWDEKVAALTRAIPRSWFKKPDDSWEYFATAGVKSEDALAILRNDEWADEAVGIRIISGDGREVPFPDSRSIQTLKDRRFWTYNLVVPNANVRRELFATYNLCEKEEGGSLRRLHEGDMKTMSEDCGHSIELDMKLAPSWKVLGYSSANNFLVLQRRADLPMVAFCVFTNIKAWRIYQKLLNKFPSELGPATHPVRAHISFVLASVESKRLENALFRRLSAVWSSSATDRKFCKNMMSEWKKLEQEDAAKTRAEIHAIHADTRQAARYAAALDAQRACSIQ